MNKTLEDMDIYTKYNDLYYYTYLITEKYPKYEKNSLVSDIKHIVYLGFCDIVYAQKNFNKTERLKYLNKLDTELKVLKMLIRISYKRKYININNYEAWSRKITNISNLMGAWIKACLKHQRKVFINV